MMSALMETSQLSISGLASAADVPTVIEAVSGFFRQHGLYYGHGTDNPLDEAAWLVAAVLGWPEDWTDHQLNATQLENVSQLAQQRVADRRPLAYLLGEGWLSGLKFFIDERVLVPRSPLAELIEQGLAPWLDSARISRVLDLGTGSGCLAIVLANFLDQALVDATDIDPGALRIARANVSRHGLADRIRVVHSDLFSALDQVRYDAILANPPYVPASSMVKLPNEYGHEPASALVAGDDGLEYARRILAAASGYLTAGGALFLEVGEAADALIDAYPRVPFTWLEFARGGDGVLVLTADQLSEYFAV